MRKWMYAVVLALGMGGFVTALYASGAFTGTWKLDPAKSKYTTGAPPKEETVIIEQTGNQEEITVTGTAADGSPMSGKYMLPANGGEGTVSSGAYDSISQKVVSANVRDVAFTKGGKEVLHLHSVVSKDGKTMRTTVQGTTAQGKPVAGMSVFEKQ